MKLTKVTARVKIIKRLNNSINDNPRFLLLLNDELVQTKSDAIYIYSIENLSDKNCLCECDIYSTKNGTLKLQNIKRIRRKKISKRI